MNRKPDVETILAETQAPRLVDSDHRQRLKNQLIQERRKESPIMIRWMTVHQKTAWALGLFLMTAVVTTSWAGYTNLHSYIYNGITHYIIHSERIEVQNSDGAPGQVETVTVVTGVISDATMTANVTKNENGEFEIIIDESTIQYGVMRDNPAFAEKAAAIHQEFQSLLAQKQFDYLGEELDSGVTVYRYKITLSDGRKIEFLRPQPIE